jgi:hypothetical protein
MDNMNNLLQNWITAEPAASLWLGIVAVLLFGVTFSQLSKKEGYSWGRGLLISLTKALAFVSLAIMSYFLLDNGFKAFNQIYGPFVTNGSISNRAWQKWRAMYGGTYDQQDLLVTQYIPHETQEVIPPANPQKPPLYRNVRVEQPLEQNSIQGFRGKVNINVTGEHDQKETFNGYALSAVYEYDIVNPATTETRAEFRFPTSPETRLYQNVGVSINGEETPWRMVDGAIFWEKRLLPNEKYVMSIHFDAWGENNFQFEVTQPREITNFSLIAVLNTDNC